MPSRKDMVEYLQRYLDGALAPEEVARLEQRLKADPELGRQLQVCRALRKETAEAPDLRHAARGLIDRFVRDLRRSRRSKGRALLIFDSGLLPLPAGIRPAALDSRRLKYAVDDLRLEVTVYPASPGSYEIIGQVEGLPTNTPLDIMLTRGRTVLREKGNPFQVFHFDRVPDGEYLLTVATPDKVRYEFALEL